MEQKTVEFTCTSCGKRFDVPVGLEQFSCLYCGEKMSLAELPEVPETMGPERAYVEAHLIDCIKNYPKIYQKFNRKEYNDTFYSYKRGIEEIFRQMNSYVMENLSHQERLLQEFAACFLDAREEYHKQDKRWARRNKREDLLFESKLIIAWFTVPAIYDMELPISEDFISELHKQYTQRYPNSPFVPGTFGEISSGFRKGKLCFITTAVCEFERKPDDCPELQAFREFRDGWLAQSPGGPALIEEYYQLAPAIVTAIDFCDDRRARYTQLRQEYLNPCYEALQRRDYTACRAQYVQMVETLKQRFCLSA